MVRDQPLVRDVVFVDPPFASDLAVLREIGGDAKLDPGIDSAHGFVPADSADVQRELLEGGDHGNAIGNTESGDEHSWG